MKLNCKLVLFHIHKSLYMILDKSMIIFIVTGNNNIRHTIIIYNSDIQVLLY
jgi:hypothetical protein